MKKNESKTLEEKMVEINFGKMIKRLREKFNYTQDCLADEINLTNQTISNIENHGQNVGIGTIMLFAKAFNMSISELLTYYEE